MNNNQRINNYIIIMTSNQTYLTFARKSKKDDGSREKIKYKSRMRNDDESELKKKIKS